MFKVRIVTPTGLYKETEASILNIVTTEGQRGILSNHMAIVCMLVISKMTIEETDGRREYAIGQGMVYFKDNLATLLIDTIESKEEIDLPRAVEAKARAEKRIQSQEGDLKRAEIALKKAINRINVKG